MSLPSLDDLMSMEISAMGSLLPAGPYNGVITNVEVRSGGKGPYLNIEVTIHDEDHRGRKVWRNSSFSEKAIPMPGGIAELVQATKPELNVSRPEDLPQALAQAVTSSPIGIVVDHEERVKNGAKVVDPVSGEVQLRETVASFFEPSSDFVDKFTKESAGVDDSLPF